MQQSLTESMAGRFETIPVTHWSFEEMRNAHNFDLDQFIYFGGYPSAAQFIQDQDRWSAHISESHIGPVIDRDILSIQRIHKPGLLKAFLELAASSSGQVVSFNKMVNQLQDAGNTTTLARYLDLFSRVGLLTGIPNLSMSNRRRRASSPKLIVHNAALMTANSGYSFEEARADRSYWGRLVQTAIGAHLLNTKAHYQSVYYWRQGTEEVDFVVGEWQEIIAIEVLSGNKLPRTLGLDLLTDEVKASRLTIGGDVSVAEFLSSPVSELLDSD